MRQIARETGVSHSTIRRLSDRLGRHCLLFHEAMKPKHCPNEPIVLDGFRTFEHSQYWPMDLNWVVGTSLFVYGFNDAELRRSGTMRPAQAVKRTILERRYGRPEPRATERQVHELLERVIQKGGTVTLRNASMKQEVFDRKLHRTTRGRRFEQRQHFCRSRMRVLTEY